MPLLNPIAKAWAATPNPLQLLQANFDPQFWGDIGQNLLSAQRGAARGIPAELLGAPVDLLQMGVQAGTAPLRIGRESMPYLPLLGSSEWVGNKMESADLIGPREPGAPYAAGEYLSPLLLAKIPDAAEMLLRGAPHVARGANDLLSGYYNRLQPQIFAGEHAKTADLIKLSEAKDLEKAGVPRETIWEKTGWFKGPEGKWRFEIDDSKAGISRHWTVSGYDTSPNKVAVNDVGRLNPSLSHPELFEAYPDLQDVRYSGRFEYGPDNRLWRRHDTGEIAQGSGGGVYERLKDSIEASGLGYTRRIAKEGVKSSTLHEGMHAIQDREGFALGGDPAVEIRGYRNIANDLNAQIEAINAQLKKHSGTPKYDDLLAERHNLVSELRKIEGQYGFGAIEKGMEDYKRLAGEVEARAVQARMNMTPAERRAVPPWKSYDRPENDLIVRTESGLLGGAGEGSRNFVLFPGEEDAASIIARNDVTGPGLLRASEPAPLEMSYSARMARARDMGFETSERWYHGSTHDIESFSKERGNRDSWLGRGHYFSSNPADAGGNYASIEGPDVRNRIALETERQQDILSAKFRRTHGRSWTKGEEGDAIKKTARDRALARVTGSHQGAIYPAHLKMKNPAKLGGRAGDSWIDFTPKMNAEGDIIADSKNAERLYDYFRREGERRGFDWERAWAKFNGEIELFDEVSAGKLVQALKSENVAYTLPNEFDDIGDFAQGALRALGFDGAVMDAHLAFPKMEGVSPGTMHAIAFRPDQIRSPNAAFDPAKKRSGNILAGVGGGAIGAGLLAGEREYE